MIFGIKVKPLISTLFVGHIRFLHVLCIFGEQDYMLERSGLGP